jgi:protein-S-isoprenylcysteine O-methyltransferase Ste14
MYLSMAEVLGITIALASSIVLIVLTTIAHYQIQKENKFLRSRLRAMREHYEKTTRLR